MRRQHDPSSGYTLVELLLAMALLAVIAVLLLNAITDARRGMAVLDREGAQAPVQAAQAVLRRLLLEARPDPSAPEQADPARAFVGGPDRLHFVSSFVPQGQYGGLWHIEIKLDPDTTGTTGQTLVLVQRLVRPSPSGPEATPATRTVVLDGVLALRLRYFGALDIEAPPAWQDTWRHPSRVPALIAVDLAFADTRRWTSLVVAPALTN